MRNCVAREPISYELRCQAVNYIKPGDAYETTGTLTAAYEFYYRPPPPPARSRRSLQDIGRPRCCLVQTGLHSFILTLPPPTKGAGNLESFVSALSQHPSIQKGATLPLNFCKTSDYGTKPVFPCAKYKGSRVLFRIDHRTKYASG